MPRKLRILFLCTANACRSQMAEGWTRHLRSEALEPYSAGTRPTSLDPRAVRVMSEVGVDITGQRSKHRDELAGVEFDYVVTVCDRARASCPTLPAGTEVVHMDFDDPPACAADAHTEEEALDHYRRVRDEIRLLAEHLPGPEDP